MKIVLLMHQNPIFGHMHKNVAKKISTNNHYEYCTRNTQDPYFKLFGKRSAPIPSFMKITILMHQNLIFWYKQKNLTKNISETTHYENYTIDTTKHYFWVCTSKSGKHLLYPIFYENCTIDELKPISRNMHKTIGKKCSITSFYEN